MNETGKTEGVAMTSKLNDAELDLVCGGGFKELDIVRRKPSGSSAPSETKQEIGPDIPPETLPSLGADQMQRL